MPEAKRRCRMVAAALLQLEEEADKMSTFNDGSRDDDLMVIATSGDDLLAVTRETLNTAPPDLPIDTAGFIIRGDEMFEVKVFSAISHHGYWNFVDDDNIKPLSAHPANSAKKMSAERRPAEGDDPTAAADETPLTWPERNRLLYEVTMEVGSTAEVYIKGVDRVMDGALSRKRGGFHTLTTDDLQTIINSSASTATQKDASRTALRLRGVPVPGSQVRDTEQSRLLRAELRKDIQQMKRDGIIPMPVNDW